MRIRKEKIEEQIFILNAYKEVLEDFLSTLPSTSSASSGNSYNLYLKGSYDILQRSYVDNNLENVLEPSEPQLRVISKRSYITTLRERLANSDTKEMRTVVSLELHTISETINNLQELIQE